MTQFYQLKRNYYLLRQDVRPGTSRTSRPPTPRDRAVSGKLRPADTRSTRLLMENPQEEAVAPAFPHRHFTTPTPGGLPGAAPALPSSTAEVLPRHSSRASRRWPGRGLRGHAARQELSVLAARGLLEPTGTGQSRDTGATAGSGCREQGRTAQEGAARLQQRPRRPSPAPPRAAALAAGTAQTPRARCAPKLAAVFSGYGGQFGTGICRGTLPRSASCG